MRIRVMVIVVLSACGPGSVEVQPGISDGDTTTAASATASASTSAGTGSTTGASAGTDGGTSSSMSSSSAGTTGANATQSGSSDGSTGPDLPDADDDGVPDGDDPFPRDPDLPGVVEPGLVYLTTLTELAVLEPADPFPISDVTAFSFPEGGSADMWDLAIDRFGVLYAVTVDDLCVCHPQTGACYPLVALSEEHNAMTVVPPGVLQDGDDTIILGTYQGDWRQVTLDGANATISDLGTISDGYGSTGDATTLGTTVYVVGYGGGTPSDKIYTVDAATGTFGTVLTTLTGHSDTYALAVAGGDLYAATGSGVVLRINAQNGGYDEIGSNGRFWAGAASAHE